MVPANASRFFPSKADAISQPHALIDLAWDESLGIVTNGSFDESLISHDAYYCTSVANILGEIDLPITRYFDSLSSRHFSTDHKIIDIGCGQGEFVDWLRNRGYDAQGYDPVVSEPNAFLFNEYWNPDSMAADLFVMRCVLPHIPNPWHFLNSLFDRHPAANVLIEFQDLEWILNENIWWQFSHDHVNSFTIGNFTSHYPVIDTGTYANGEWSWVLIGKATKDNSGLHIERNSTIDARLTKAQDVRQETLSVISEQFLDKYSDFVLWGAAGKGIVIADALVHFGLTELSAVDSDMRRWAKYLECSGVLVHSPETLKDSLNSNTYIVVSNPNHLEAVTTWVDSRCNVGTLTSLHARLASPTN